MRDHAGAAFAVDVNPLFVQEQRGDAADLPHVDDGVGFVEQLLVAGEDGLDEIAVSVAFSLVVRVEEFTQSAEAAFLGEAGQCGFGHAQALRQRFAGFFRRGFAAAEEVIGNFALNRAEFLQVRFDVGAGVFAEDDHRSVSRRILKTALCRVSLCASTMRPVWCASSG